MGTMQGISKLFNLTGRISEWERLVAEIVPVFVDPVNEKSFPDYEEYWDLVIGYRINLAIRQKNFHEAQRLQKIRLGWSRSQAEPLLKMERDALTEVQRNIIRGYSVSLQNLGQIQMELGDPECKDSHLKAFEVFQSLEMILEAAICAFNLGSVYLNLHQLFDLDKAEYYYRQSLKLGQNADDAWKAGSEMQLGRVAQERFIDARKHKRPKVELLKHLNKSLNQYHKALAMLPENAVTDLAVTLNQIGRVYQEVGQIAKAMHHYNESIRYMVSSGDSFGAGQIRRNIAFMMAQHGRFEEALLYANASLKSFEPYGDGAKQDIAKTRELIAQIEDWKKQGEGS